MSDEQQHGCCGEVTESLSQHEINYTPSRWCKRYDHEELLKRWDNFTTKSTARARKTIKCKLDVPYGNTSRTKYDIYGVDLPENAPIFVFIHGGYWQEGSKDYAGFVSLPFVESGVKVIAIGYDLCPNVRMGEIVAEIKTAVNQILSYAANGKCSRVWISGHSAGAHLTASLLHDRQWLDNAERRYPGLLKGLMLISGIYHLRPLLSTSFNDPLQLTDNEIETYSFSKVNTEKYKPVHGLKVVVTVGECDSPVFVAESQEYAKKIISFVDRVEYVLLRDSVDHFSIAEKLLEKDYVLTNLLLKELTEQQ